jgi:hypothetical protein
MEREHEVTRGYVMMFSGLILVNQVEESWFLMIIYTFLWLIGLIMVFKNYSKLK